jgi:2-(1,2-epoxy-1,2-dihydrophenyl)acetyl-CoA isomerase
MASVISERSGAVQRLQLNEPDSMNALSKTLSAERARGVASAVADPDVRCILLTGTGRAFCAGGDIRALDDRRPGAVRAPGRCASLLGEAIAARRQAGRDRDQRLGSRSRLCRRAVRDVVIASDAARFRAAFLGLNAVPDCCGA